MNKYMLLPLVLCISSGVSHSAEWSHTGENGPEYWGNSFEICGTGLNQAPIDISTTTESELESLQVIYNNNISDILNNGHTIQVNSNGDNKLKIDNLTFELKQFHFHTPSENTIQGNKFPLEAHFVHSTDDGQLAVVAVFFETKKNDNNELNILLENIPDKNKEKVIKNNFNPVKLLPSDLNYYRFNGSLTTPPCSEGVRWFVIKTPQTISQEQVTQLNNVMGDNIRPIQPLNARVVLE